MIRVERRDSHALIGGLGRMDVAAGRELREAITRSFSSGSRLVVLDMSGAEISDSSILGVLLACQREASAAGGNLRLARASARVSALLARVDIERRLVPFPSVEQAVGG